MAANSDSAPDLEALLLELRLAGKQQGTPEGAAAVQRLRRKLRASLSRNDSVRREMDSEDLANEGLLRLIRYVDGFRGTTLPELVAYAKSLTNNVKIDAARHMRASPLDAGRDGEHQPQARAPSAFAPSKIAATREQIDASARALRALPDKHREPLEMHLRSIPHSEIAKALSLSEEAVRQRVRRALAMIRAQVGGSSFT